MPRPDSRIAHTGQHPVIGLLPDHKSFAREHTRRQLQELEQLMRVNHDPTLERPRYHTFDDAAKTLGLDAEKTRKASNLIGQVAKDARSMLAVSKSAAEQGLPSYVIPELIRRGVQMHHDRIRDERLSKAGIKHVPPKPPGDPKEEWSPKEDKPGTAKVIAKDKAKKESGKDGKDQPPGKGKGPPDKKGPPSKGAVGKDGKESLDLDGNGKPDVDIDGAATDVEIGDEPPKGPAHPDIEERFKGIQDAAAKHGIKVRPRGEGLTNQHTHEHLDALEHKIATRVNEQFPGAMRHQAKLEGAAPGEEQAPMGQGGAPGEGVGPADMAEPMDPNAQPGPGGMPPGGAGMPGGAGTTPPGAMPSDLAAKQMQQDVMTVKQKLDAVQGRLDSPHAQSMFTELQGDLKSLLGQPDKAMLQWLEQRIDSFIQMLTGQAAAPPPGAQPPMMGGAQPAQPQGAKPGGFPPGGPKLGLPTPKGGGGPPIPHPPGAIKPPMAPKPPMAKPPVAAAPPIAGAPPKPKPFGKSDIFLGLPVKGEGISKAAGPFIGPRGGRWADPGHKVPYKDPKPSEPGPREGEGHEITLSQAQLDTLLTRGNYSIVSAGPNSADPQEKGHAPDEPQFKERHEKLRAELVKQGFNYTEVIGHYGGQEPSFVVFHHALPKATPAKIEQGGKLQAIPGFIVHHSETAGESEYKKIRDIGKQFNQDSVVHSYHGDHELHFTTAHSGHAGQHLKGSGYTRGAGSDYTEVSTRSGAHTQFALNFDWDKPQGMRTAMLKARLPIPAPPKKRSRVAIDEMLRKAFANEVLVQTMEDGTLSLIGDLQKSGVPAYMITGSPLKVVIDYDAAVALHSHLTEN